MHSIEASLKQASLFFPIPNPARNLFFPIAVFVSAALLPLGWITAAFIVAGQAHFAMTYLYQYRGKRMNYRYFSLALFLFGAMLLYLTYAGEEVLPIFFVVAASLFSAHFAFDEIHLHGSNLSRMEGATALGFVALFTSFMLYVAFPFSPFLELPFLIALIFGSWVLTRLVFSKASISRGEYYLWFVEIILVTLFFWLGLTLQTLAVIILLHGFNWAVGYGERVNWYPERKKKYWSETALTLGGSIILYVFFLTLNIEFLKYFFLLVYYDAWAIAHIVLSFNPSRSV